MDTIKIYHTIPYHARPYHTIQYYAMHTCILYIHTMHASGSVIISIIGSIILSMICCYVWVVGIDEGIVVYIFVPYPSIHIPSFTLEE